MDYGNPRNFERLTGQCIFTPEDSSDGIDLGNVVMHKVDYGIERKEVYRSQGGKKILAREDAISSKPVWEFQGNEFIHSVLPLVLLGTRNANAVQASANNATLTVTVAEGMTYDLNKLSVSGVVVTYGAGPATAVAGTDYILDAAKGLIRIPVGSVLDGEEIDIEFDAAAVTMSSFKAFTTLNRQGTIKLFEEDEFSTVPKSVITFPCTLSADDKGDVTSDDFSQFTLKATVIGEMIVKKRQDAA